MQVTHPKISEYGAEEWKRERALDEEIRNTNWGVDDIWWGWCCANMREILEQNEEVRAESRAGQLKVFFFFLFVRLWDRERQGRTGVYKRPEIDFGERNLENIYKSCGWLAMWDPHGFGFLPLFRCLHSKFSNSSLSLSFSLFWLIENICVSV